MSDTDAVPGLVKLSEATLTVADPAADVRGRKVIDRGGDEVGEVKDLLVDEREKKVRFLEVAAGGFLGIGEQHFLIPVDAVSTIETEEVHVDKERAELKDVPPYDPELAQEPDTYAAAYRWWGYAPYWTLGYAYPPYPYYR